MPNSVALALQTDGVRLRPVAFLGAAVALVACGTASEGPPVAPARPLTTQARCDAALAQLPIAEHPRLVAVFESTALEVAAWQESGLMPGHARAGKGMSPLRTHPPDESVASCYYDGSFVFSGPRPPPMPGAPPEPEKTFERLLLIIDGTGNALGELGGSKELLPLVRPAA